MRSASRGCSTGSPASASPDSYGRSTGLHSVAFVLSFSLCTRAFGGYQTLWGRPSPERNGAERMTNRIPDLKQVRASRAASASAPHQSQRPRLAERLATLAPLARAPLVAESERLDPDDGLSRLSHVSRSYQPNALVPLQPSPLPRAREPDRLLPVGVSPPAVPADEAGARQDLTGFLIGLAIATIAGLTLYILLA